MESHRQAAFQKLRPPCVELSSVGLRFKAKQATVKEVLHAIHAQSTVLQDLGSAGQLDSKLTGYAFFPLSHIFNEAQNLSDRCLESAVESVEVLVAQGWRQEIPPDMGKQLLILMSLLAGGHPSRPMPESSDELKIAVFRCMTSIVTALASSSRGKSALDEEPTRNIIDQLVYLLVESLTESSSAEVQFAASGPLLALFEHVSDRVFLASLMPRTVSSLTKCLRPSAQAKRTSKVLSANLGLLQTILCKVLANDVALSKEKLSQTELDALDDSWLKATSTQVKNSIIQVVKLRNHDKKDVRDALSHLCVMVLEQCSQTLADSVSVVLETLVILSGTHGDRSLAGTVRGIIFLHPQLGEILQSSFFEWCQTLPNVMRASDDKKKELMMSRIANSFDLLGEVDSVSGMLVDTLAGTIVKSIATTLEDAKPKSVEIHHAQLPIISHPTKSLDRSDNQFRAIILDHKSQLASREQLERLIINLRAHTVAGKITRDVVDMAASSEGIGRLAATWLAVNLLRKEKASAFDLDDIIIGDDLIDRNTSRPFLISDLYTATRDGLLESSPSAEQPPDYRLTALSLECLVLQAQQHGLAYRPELFETLYPIIALFSSRNPTLRSHAITTIDHLSQACGYDSPRDMLVENMDYLVNSIAWKLNVFALSPGAPQVLNMILRLVGAKAIPYLDDLVVNIFAALDRYHGHTVWVETLFEVLKTMVDESTKQPELVIEESQAKSPANERILFCPSTSVNVFEDLRSRKRLRLAHNGTDAARIERESAPERPWTKPADDPTYNPEPSLDASMSLEDMIKANDEAPLEPPATDETEHNQNDETSEGPVTKSHDLLLKIARSTVPHLSSPSPRIRRLLLDLLMQVTPLLARHEDTFLPLVHGIWDGVVIRLFPAAATEASSIQKHNMDFILQESGETGYNIIAAAQVVTVLCETAGDFMTARIDKIFSPLVKLFKKTLTAVQQQRKRHENTNPSPDYANATIQHTDRSKYTTPVNLHIIARPPDIKNNTTSSSDIVSAHKIASDTHIRTSQSQLLTTLIDLLLSIITHVTIPLDHRDQIFDLLTPILLTASDRSTDTQLPTAGIDTDKLDRKNNGNRENSSSRSSSIANKVKAVCEKVNPDLVWYIYHIGDGSKDKDVTWDKANWVAQQSSHLS